MPRTTLLAQLSTELVRLAPAYAAVVKDDAAFVRYPTLASLRVAVQNPDALPFAERSSLLCALLAHAQETRGRVWSLLLVNAFDGMLVRLGRAVGADDDDDRAANVVTSFLQVLAHVRVAKSSTSVAMIVRKETRRTLFATLRRERAAEGFGLDIDADTVADPATLAPIEEALTVRDPSIDDVTDAELLHTHLRHGSLRRLARRLFARSSRQEQDYIYGRLARRRDRLVSAMRSAVAPAGQPSNDSTSRAS